MYRITLKSATGFFKNDMTITSVQQTYECPPLSTIYGLIAAATGEKTGAIPVGYIFDYRCKGEDYELVTRPLGSEYRKPFRDLIESGKAIDRHDVLQGFFGAVPITREILFRCTLRLYIEDENIAESFLKPYYPLLMGRSEDLAFVKEVKPVELKSGRTNILVGKTIIPFNASDSEVYGRICSMPVCISEDIPRKVVKTGVYMIVDNHINKIGNRSGRFLYDEEIRQGVYMHGSK